MGLYRRNPSKVWYVDITKPDGKRHRESTETENKQLAQAFHDKLKHELWQEAKLGIKADKTLKDAVDKFLYEKRQRKTVDDYRDQLNWWLEQFGEKTLLSKVTQDRIIELIEKKHEAGSAAATCNRYLAALKACLRLVAIKHKWMDVNKLPVFFPYEEPKGRVRWLSAADMGRFLEACPDHIKPVALFALATGLRRSNVTQLRWSQIDMQRQCLYIDGDEMKAGQDLGVPLSAEAMAVLSQQIGKHKQYVFTYRGKPFKVIGYDTWNQIKEKAGLDDFRWHDLRHCWATMMVRGGVPLYVIQMLGAWKSEKMVLRYGHQNTDSLKPYTEVAGNVLCEVTSQFTSHPGSGTADTPRLRTV